MQSHGFDDRGPLFIASRQDPANLQHAIEKLKSLYDGDRGLIELPHMASKLSLRCVPCFLNGTQAGFFRRDARLFMRSYRLKPTMSWLKFSERHVRLLIPWNASAMRW